MIDIRLLANRNTFVLDGTCLHQNKILGCSCCFSCDIPTTMLHAQSGWNLEQCILHALEHNLNVENRALDIVASASEKERALGLFLPSINGFASHGYNWGRRIDPFTNTFADQRVRSNSFSLSGNMDLFQGLRNQNTWKQAKLNIQVSELALEAAKTQVRIDVTDAFLAVLSRREQLKVNEIQVVQTQDRLTALQERVDAGLVARGDLFDMKAQLAQEEFNVAQMEGFRDQNMLVLMQLMQLPVVQRSGFTIASPSSATPNMTVPDVPFAQVMDEVRAQYPAYQQAKVNAESAEKGVDIARSGRLPSLTLSGSIGTGYSGLNAEVFGEPTFGAPQEIGFTNSGETVFAPNVDFDTRIKSFGDQFNDNINKSLTLGLSIPIFNGFQNKVNIAQARIREQQAMNSVRAVDDQLSTLVQNALVTQRSSNKQYLAAQRAHESAEEAYRYAEQRYEQKVITVVEMNVSRTNRDKAQAQMIDAKYAYLFASKYLDILKGSAIDW